MSVVNSFIHKMAHLLSALLNIKGLVALSALLILLWGDIRWEALTRWDSHWINAIQLLAPAREVKSPIAFIEVDEEAIEGLARDPLSSELLPLLYPGQQNENQPLISLLMPEPIREQASYAEQRLMETNSSAFDVYSAVQTRLERGEILVGLTQRGVSSFPEQAYPVAEPKWFEGAVSGLLARAPEFLTKPGLALALWLDERMALSAPTRAVNPRLQGAGYRALDSRQLLWLQESQYHPGLVLSLYTRYLATSMEVPEEPRALFNKGYGIEMAHRWLPISSNSGFLPAQIPGAVFSAYSLDAALAAPPVEPIWIIAASANQAQQVSQSFLALQSHQYLFSPYWAGLFQGVMVLLLAIYVLYLQPMLRQSMAVTLLAFMVSALLVFQIVWQLSFHQLLPVPLLVQWFVPAALLMMLWKQRKKHITQLQWAYHNRSYELAQLSYQQGNLDYALSTLRDCKTTESVLALMYDIAVQQERKRNYQQAAATYDLLVQRKPKYKDAKKRAEALHNVAQPAPTAVDFSATHSLVMPSQEFSNPVLGRYEIVRELGRGAMGIVYQGIDPKIARKVAIKTLSYREFDHDQLEPIKERFFREAEAAGRLNHPNIVTIFDVGEEDDLAFIAMDFVEGVSLDRCVSESSLLAVQDVYEVVASVADALYYAHQQNIVHRDIKPANILYDQHNGQIKVADFGIARIVDDSKTKTGDMLGSPVYMSPEQLKGTKVSGASDIYSLGVTLYQLLTGSLPYNGDSIANLAYQILNKKYKSVREVRPDLSAGVVRIVNKAMHKDPAKRYDNAAAMADALRGLCSREFGKKAS